MKFFLSNLGKGVEQTGENGDIEKSSRFALLSNYIWMNNNNKIIIIINIKDWTL